MSVIPVNAVPKFISGTFSQAYVIKNSGSATVYIGQDSSLTIPSRAFSLTPGAVLQWPANSSEVWAMTDAGKVSELEILYSSQAVYTPGPENVTATIDGPVDIGNTVTVDGELTLTQDITRLFGGLVSVVPNDFTPFASIDVSSFSAVYLQFAWTGAYSAFDPTKEYGIIVRWFATSAGFGTYEVATDEFSVNFQSRAEMALTVKAELMTVEPLYWFDVATPRGMYLGVQGIRMAVPEWYRHIWGYSGNPWTGFSGSIQRTNNQGGFNFLAEHNVSSSVATCAINHYSGKSQLARILQYVVGTNSNRTIDYAWTLAIDLEAKIFGNVLFNPGSEVRVTNSEMFLPRRPIVYLEFFYGTAGAIQGVRISQWFMGVNAEK